MIIKELDFQTDPLITNPSLGNSKEKQREKMFLILKIRIL